VTRPALHDWPALVLAAGLATRLQPLSRVRAKAALPVAGTTLIARTLLWLHAAGVRRVVINLHHRADTITRLVGDGRAFGLAVRYSWEDPVLGSAGGPRRALPLLDSARFLIVNGDTLTDADLGALAAQHVARRALVTMAVVPGDTARYGGVQADASDQVTGFARAMPGAASAPRAADAPGHFIGVQAAEAAAFADAPDDAPSESVHWLYPRLIAARPGAVQVYRSHAAFFDIGTPRDYLDTVRAFAAREGRGLDAGADTVVDPTAHVAGSVLWDRVRIGPRARLTGCIVTDDVVVPAGASHTDAMLVGGPEGLDVISLP